MASVPSEFESQFPAVPAPLPSETGPSQESVDAETEHHRFPTRSTSDPEAMRRFAIEAARMLSDDRCEDVLCLDVRSLSQVSDYIVIASGTSDRQMRGAADDIERLADQHHFRVFRRSQDDRATWIVLDCVDIVVHIFEPNMRAHYDLEMLWGDAERVKWEREGGGARSPGGRAAHPGHSDLTAAEAAEGVESDADQGHGDIGADFDTGDSEIDEESLTSPESGEDEHARPEAAAPIAESRAETPSLQKPRSRGKTRGTKSAKPTSKAAAGKKSARSSAQKSPVSKKRIAKKAATKKTAKKKTASKSAKKSARKKR